METKPMRKHRNHKSNGHHNGKVAKLVHVAFSHPAAAKVAIAGTFNEWRPEATPMVSMGEGRWLKELVLPPGTYEYLFVADGQWLADPLAEGSVPNPYGGTNSLLTVPNDRPVAALGSRSRQSGMAKDPR